MKLVYVAGPYRGPNAFAIDRNIHAARCWAAEVWARGMAAICPHANTAHFDGLLPDEVFLEGGIEILSRCDAVLLIDGWRSSAGSVMERDRALEMSIPLFEDLEKLCDWYARTPERRSA